MPDLTISNTQNKLRAFLKKIPLLVPVKRFAWAIGPYIKNLLIRLKARINILSWQRKYSSLPNRVIYSTFGPIIINNNDQYIAAGFKKAKYWDAKTINLIKSLANIKLKDNKQIVFYDVGANIGAHTLAISKIFSDRVRIRSFEAQRPIYNMLCGTMALNNITNVNCHLNAISDTDGEIIEIQLPNYDAFNNFGGLELLPPATSDNQDMIKSGLVDKVSTISLDSFDEKVDLIKMDIEGMEDKALKGAINTLKKYRPLCVVEIRKTDKNLVHRLFEELNYIQHPESTDFDAIFIPEEYSNQIRN